MANFGNRILYILKYLYELTDSENYLTAQQIIDLLAAEGIHTQRKTIIADIGDLMDCGVNITCVKSKQNRYNINSRMFTLPELTLLKDAVSASRMLTQEQKAIRLLKSCQLLPERIKAHSL